MSFLAILKDANHLLCRMDSKATFIGPGTVLCQSRAAAFLEKGCHDAVIAPDNERQIADHIVERH